MDFIVIVTIVYLVVIVVTLLAIWFFQERLFRETPTSEGGGAPDVIGQYITPSPWSPPQPTNLKVGCQAYRVNYGVSTTYSSLENPSNIAQTLPTSAVQCLDPDTLTAQEFQRTCIAENPYPCVSFSSTRFSMGQSENFLASCGTLKPCTGLFGVLQVGTCASGICSGACITVSNNTPTLSSQCLPNPTVGSSNLFRLDRATVTVTDTPTETGFTTTLSFTPNPSGLYARIIHRETGLYLSPQVPKDSKGLFLPNQVKAGDTVTLLPATQVPNQGYIWALVDPLDGYIPAQKIVYSPSGTNFPPYVGLTIGCKTPCPSGTCQVSGVCTNNVDTCYYNSSVSQGTQCPPGYAQNTSGGTCTCNTYSTWYANMQEDGNALLTLVGTPQGGLSLETFAFSTGSSGSFSTVLDYLPLAGFNREVQQVSQGKFPLFISTT